MVPRQLLESLSKRLVEVPAVALLGPRQVGKTSLALQVGNARPSLYLDLESDRDRAKLANPESYLESHHDKLVILDEIHRAPGLFPVLRGQIDKARRQGRRSGLYLLLGSASIDLLQQSGESLAGRISYLELGPLHLLEVHNATETNILWQRGGFPESLLAPSEPTSMRWRGDFIRTYLERDVQQFVPKLAAETLRRFWIMLAHRQAALLNEADLARSLGIDVKTCARYLDLLVDLLLVRRLEPWHANVGKRLVKSPKVYLRDSGLLHSLLGIANHEQLLSHPVVGASWEGFVLETLIAQLPPMVQPFFYRTAAGAEIDLLLAWPDGQLWAVEVKRSEAPKVERGFHSACADLNPSRKLVVYPGRESFALGQGITATHLAPLAHELREMALG